VVPADGNFLTSSLNVSKQSSQVVSYVSTRIACTLIYSMMSHIVYFLLLVKKSYSWYVSYSEENQREFTPFTKISEINK
jgi:hypothetical protein